MNRDKKEVEANECLPRITAGGKERVLSMRRDRVDFRDRMYVPSLIEVPPIRSVEEYKLSSVPILDQGQEGACTGFGLATVANYLLRTRNVLPDSTNVSERMLYEMAKRYDEWPGENYEGSSARGAMKGWHKHGVCTSQLWIYDQSQLDSVLTTERARDALKRPLGAYYRVNHKNLVALHSAITEVGILYAASLVHDGWSSVKEDGIIVRSDNIVGGHAFAIVGYDQHGFWIQNSWGTNWGKEGFGRISYADWLENAVDVWVARLGVPVFLSSRGVMSRPILNVRRKSHALVSSILRPHIISLGNNGRLYNKGRFATTEADLDLIIEDFVSTTSSWKKKRLVIYAHGGLVDEHEFVESAIKLKDVMLKQQIYPLFLSWHTDIKSTLADLLEDAIASSRSAGLLEELKELMLDRIDNSLEAIVRKPGKAIWDEMKENAVSATISESGGLRLLGSKLKSLSSKYEFDIHLVSHSAGSILQAYFAQLVASNTKVDVGPLQYEEGLSLPIKTCTLWAPACTTKLFKATYLPLVKSHQIENCVLFTMTDAAERRDTCKNIYNKSLLYLVSNSLEEKFCSISEIERECVGEPIMGMEKFINSDATLKACIDSPMPLVHIISNISKNGKEEILSTATHHGDFDSDQSTIKATKKIVIGGCKSESAISSMDE